jgi:hypothetical protein
VNQTDLPEMLRTLADKDPRAFIDGDLSAYLVAEGQVGEALHG